MEHQHSLELYCKGPERVLSLLFPQDFFSGEETFRWQLMEALALVMEDHATLLEALGEESPVATLPAQLAALMRGKPSAE